MSSQDGADCLVILDTDIDDPEAVLYSRCNDRAWIESSVVVNLKGAI